MCAIKKWDKCLESDFWPSPLLVQVEQNIAWQAGAEMGQAQDKPDGIVDIGVEVGVKVEAYHY